MVSRKWDLDRVKKEHVRYAARVWDKNNGYKNFKNSILYDVIIDGKAYPPKAISVCAYERATQIALTPYDLARAKDGAWHQRLKQLGFTIVSKAVS